MSETIEKPAAPKSTEGPANEHYARLLQGMAQAVAVKGYAETTIADIAAQSASGVPVRIPVPTPPSLRPSNG